jgi:hypothetical protein
MAGVTTAEKAVLMAALASNSSACYQYYPSTTTYYCVYDGTTYSADSGWGSTALCSGCLATAYDGLSNAARETYYYAAMKVRSFEFITKVMIH